MNKPKYKLICTQAWTRGNVSYTQGQAITQSDTQYHGGGEIAWAQEDGCAEWQENIPTVEELLADAKNTALANIKGQIAALDYKTLKYIDGDLTEAEYEPFKAQRVSLREKYNLVEAATTIEEVDSINW